MDRAIRMDTLMSFLIAGYNIPFLVALGCSVLLALLQIFAGFGESDGDANDTPADADADADHDAAHSAGAPQASAGAGALAWLGVGKVPLTMVLITFLGSFGALGLLANVAIAGALSGYPGIALFPVLIGSLILALPFTARFSGLLARLAPSSTTAVRLEQLVGRVGVVVSPTASATYGRVQVRDIHGSVHTVYAVVDGDPPLPERTEVALVKYDTRERRFLVRPIDDRRG
jgi:membrane protein implicated in regulation of membrane protease activity